MGKITKFVVVNFIIPSVLGIVMANLGVIGCVFWNKIFVQAPCWLINFLVFSLLIAIFLDILVYFVWPKFVKKPKKSELLNLEFSDVSQSDNLGKIYLSVVNNGTKKIVDLEAVVDEAKKAEEVFGRYFLINKKIFLINLKQNLEFHCQQLWLAFQVTIQKYFLKECLKTSQLSAKVFLELR